MKTADVDREALELRIDAYLDGLLSASETRETERMLARPEVAEALAEAIALREILASAPAHEPPAGLADRIIRAIGVEGPDLVALPSPRAAEGGEDLRSRGGARAALAGVGMMRYALKPLELVRRSR